MDYVLSLPLKRAFKLLNKAVEEKKRDKTYQWWLARYPTYNDDNYETFDEFYEKVYPPKVEMDTRSKEDIMNEILGKEE